MNSLAEELKKLDEIVILLAEEIAAVKESLSQVKYQLAEIIKERNK